MSKRPRRKFETGFKKQLVAQIEAGQITATEAARVHSISPTVISPTGEINFKPESS